MENYVRTENIDRVLHVVINRPERKNALNQSVVEQLYGVFSDVYGDDETAAILLYGQGEEAFSAGADLDEVQSCQGVREKKQFFRGLADLFALMNSCPKIIIAKVHGFCLAGGCGLAAAADITIASDDAQFGLPEINIGLIPMIAMAPISRSVGRKVLTDLVLTGERIPAARALEIGLISRLYPKTDLDRAALELAQKIAKSSLLALDAGKEALYDIYEADYLGALRHFSDRISLLSLSNDASEGISAFLAKRTPEWKGK